MVKYLPSFRGIKALRSSPEVDAMLEGRAEMVAAGARSAYAAMTLGMVEVPVDVVQQGSDTRSPRARVAVIARHPIAVRIEAQKRILGSALSAAGVSGRNVKRARLQRGRKSQERAAKAASARLRRKDARDRALFAQEEGV